MKKTAYLPLAALLLAAGCFSSMPPRVSPEYISGKSQAETESLEEIEREIIKISNDKEELQKSLKISKLQIAVLERELTQIEAQSKLLADKQKLNAAQNDQTGIAEVKNEIDANNKARETSSLKLEYYTAKKKHTEQQIATAEAQQAAKIAEQYLEEAKIGRAKQDSIMGPAAEETPKDRINIKEYEDYKLKTEERLASMKKEEQLTSAELAKKEKKLKAAGIDVSQLK